MSEKGKVGGMPENEAVLRWFFLLNGKMLWKVTMKEEFKRSDEALCTAFASWCNENSETVINNLINEVSPVANDFLHMLHSRNMRRGIPRISWKI